MDFYTICKCPSRKGDVIELRPQFKVGRSKDLMIRAKSFYAIWDEEKGLWSTDEYDVQRMIDKELWEFKDELDAKKNPDQASISYVVKSLSNFSSNSWPEFRRYMANVSDTYHELDTTLTFQNTKVNKNDYASKRLPYSLESGKAESYEELISTLYSPEERAKLEWAIGSVIAGDAKRIQKFIVLYGEAGAGKSTVLNIIQSLFEGYYTTFEAKELASNNNAFSTEAFKSNPLVAIQHDGDLSRIEDNTKLNSIVSHEEMTINEKFKPKYTAKINCFLFMATNKPVKITDAKSGIIRRLIDVHPTGNKLPAQRYEELVSKIPFELGAIANHCLQTYKEMGKNYYNSYRSIEMMQKTDRFYNFVEDNYFTFKEEDGIGLQRAYDMYKEYCDDALIDFKLPRHAFREEFKNYFNTFSTDAKRVDGKIIRNYYEGFKTSKFATSEIVEDKKEITTLVLDSTDSIFDKMYVDCKAQKATKDETPSFKWTECTTTLKDIDTSAVHYVKPPINHIVIDFDLKDETGKKSAEKNLEAAAQWPETYAEFSKGGSGVHLHYIFSGDVTMLANVYSDGIEIKKFTGGGSLRRRLTKCNTKPVAIISSGLPLKGAKMVNFEAVKSEKALRDLITKNLNKEIHPGTKPSIDFIHKILEDAYNSGLKFDVTDMRPAVLSFANNSTNQADYCVKLVAKMVFKSEEPSESISSEEDEPIIIYDVEVFPNLFVVVWKQLDGQKVYMINPSADAVGDLIKRKLVGFNCRRYDNHILYARYIGYTLEQLYQLSQRIINGSRNSMFGEAYNISYTDVYDFSNKKQSLKKWEIELGIHHMELGLPWDQPVPEELWDKVAKYCGNDVDATEAVFLDRKQDYMARLILAKLSGLTPNDTTRMHAGKIMFGNDKNPQSKFVYTDLSKDFPGYKFELGKSTYRGEEVGEGGYVYSEPGMYGDVPVLDIESLHPHSAIAMNVFGPYTARFKEIVDARLAIKHKELDIARGMLDGVLVEYLENEDDASGLSYALKIFINSIYGFTSAKFENLFKDPRNIDNIVAKRGALFMIDLKHLVQEKGFTVCHIKTDSIKIPDATPEIIEFVKDYGKKWGYTFEYEALYDKMCLLNDAVYVAKIKKENFRGDGDIQRNGWTATGTQLIHPYVFKTLFSKEPINFEDLCETKAVASTLYLDMNESLSEDEHNYQFIGKVGLFCPMKPGTGGGLLMREKDGKYYAATGSKGYRWLEAEIVKTLQKEDDIDTSYHQGLVDDAIKAIENWGGFDWFVSDEPYDKYINGILPF